MILRLNQTFYTRILRPNESERKDALVETLAEILWDAGEKKAAIVAVNSQKNCFEIESNDRQRRTNYVGDGLTERVMNFIFEN